MTAKAELRADLHRFRLRETAADQPLPRVAGAVQLRRTDGWLVSGPARITTRRCPASRGCAGPS